MRKINLTYCLIMTFVLFFILSFLVLSTTHAKTIWRIGIRDGYPNEFRTVSTNWYEYHIPGDWNINEDWTLFPKYLAPPELGTAPTVIHINFEYSKDYRAPLLRIRANSYGTNNTQKLLVSKGEHEQFEAILSSSFTDDDEFYLGPIKKGEDDKNKIILRNESISDNMRIYFDYLELDDQDEDGDNSLDGEELYGNPNRDTDGDGIKDHQDRDTSAIFIPNYNTASGVIVILDILEENDFLPYFREVSIVDQNSSEYPISFPENSWFYYGLFRADIQMPDNMDDTFSIRFIYHDKINAVAQFFLYNGAVDLWENVPIDVIDGNSMVITLNSKDDDPNGEISIIGGLAYPTEMDTTLEKKSCFISNLTAPFKIKSKLLKMYFIISLFFIFFLYFTRYIFRKECKSSRRRGIIPIILISCIFLITDLIHANLFEEIQSDMVVVSTPNPVGSGARALGIGGAFIAIADDATAASWNPACLLQLARPEIVLVGSNFSGKIKYDTSGIDTEIIDLSEDQQHLNYFGAMFQGFFWNRNMAFSLNYQHLYEFSKETSYVLHYKYSDAESGDTIFNIPINSNIKTIGSLNTLSPAYAIEVNPKLYLGFTINLWLNDELNNYWENLNIIKGEGVAPGGELKIKGHLYEHYDFSGLNYNIGFLWQPNWRFTLGGVVKTPFRAKIKYTKKILLLLEQPENINLNGYTNSNETIDLKLQMPSSYGIGMSMRFSDNYLMALDIYHTRWNEFLFCGQGEKISPVNRESAALADIKGTTQIRLGAEYQLLFKKYIIPIRSGVFYDPEPSRKKVDDFYGMSVGTGLTIKNIISFDIAYQYRYGKKKEAEAKFDKLISSEVIQHYFYISSIYYF